MGKAESQMLLLIAKWAAVQDEIGKQAKAEQHPGEMLLMQSHMQTGRKLQLLCQLLCDWQVLVFLLFVYVGFEAY